MKLRKIDEETHLIDLWNTMRLKKMPMNAGALPVWAYRQLEAGPDLIKVLKKVAATMPKEYSIDRLYQVVIPGALMERIYTLLNEYNKAEYVQERRQPRKPHRLAVKVKE